LDRLLRILRFMRPNDSLGVVVEVLIDSLSIHFKTLCILVDTHSLEVTPVDGIKVKWLWFPANLLELTMQAIGTKSGLSLPAKVRVHVESIIAAKTWQRPFARPALEDKQIFDRLTSGAFTWEVLGVPSLLPIVTVVLGVRIITDRLFRAILHVGIRIELKISAELLGPSLMVLQIGQRLSIDVVRAREAEVMLASILIREDANTHFDVTE